MKIMIVDRNRTVLDQLSDGLQHSQYVTGFHHGDFNELKADAIVSPANSFGYMDGGIDLAYRNLWPTIQDQVQTEIKKLPFGELLVGQAISVPIKQESNFRMLISAPTMRIPQRIPVANIYLATRAAVHLAKQTGIETMVFPGMGTGAGAVEPVQAGWAMHKGIKDGMVENYKPTLGPNWQGVAKIHTLLGTYM